MQTLTLHDWHVQLGASFGPRGRVARYNSVDAEYEILRSSAGLMDFSDRESLVLTGPDRHSFLHGMVTQDIEGLPQDQWSYAAFTTAKGAMVGDGQVLKRKDELFLDLEPESAVTLKAHLERFLISEDAEIRIASEERGVLTVTGPKALEVVADALQFRVEGRTLVDQGNTWALQHDLLGVPSVDLFVPRNELARVAEALRTGGATVVGEDAYDILRVEAGLPKMGLDMDTTTIPLEARLERAISYQKGCYVGQEVIARATFRGHVNKKLVGLTFPQGAIAAGAELFSGDKRMGKVTSSVHSPRLGTIGLGYVHRSLLEPGTELNASGQVPAVVAALPFAVPHTR